MKICVALGSHLPQLTTPTPHLIYGWHFMRHELTLGFFNTKIICCSTEMKKLEEMYQGVDGLMAHIYISCNKVTVIKYIYLIQ
jgi:hypothetical protein